MFVAKKHPSCGKENEGMLAFCYYSLVGDEHGRAWGMQCLHYSLLIARQEQLVALVCLSIDFVFFCNML